VRPACKTNDPCCEFIASVEHFAIRHPLPMRIEHWELSIGQIPGRIQGSGFCQVIFARALKIAMIVPRSKLLFWVAAVVLPFALLAAAVPGAAPVCILFVGGLGLAAFADALGSRRS